MEKGIKIDLHIHTINSDGALTPYEVVDEAVKNKVKIIAIADHDTVDAYNDNLFEYAKNKGIKLIKAVEISTKTKKAGVHVLGYNIDINNNKFKKELSKLRNARHDYLFNVGEKLKTIGYKLNVEELNKIDAVTKAHIALDVINNPNNKELLLKEFNHIPSKGEFIETIMNENCPAYVKKASITPVVAAKLIREAGGTVILAHPVAYKYEDGMTEEETLTLVSEMEADGIEGNYVYVDRNDKKINEITYWNKFAEKNNLISTVGSDFHNFDNLRPIIGLIGEDIEFSKINIDNIINN